MGLRAIQEEKVGYMIDALNTLEEIETQIGRENLDSWELKDLKTRLIDKHERYQQMLSAIEDQINDFERVYRQLKMKVLPSKLKELKTELESDSQQFVLLKQAIQLTYKY